MSENEKFEQWCVVELFGHQRIAGKVSEQVIAGQGFIRVDVPAVGGKDGYTKLYGSGAIYAISPVDEETCRLAVANVYQAPVEPYHFRATVQKSLPGFVEDEDEEEEQTIPF